jgi:hypothetical protein
VKPLDPLWWECVGGILLGSLLPAIRTTRPSFRSLPLILLSAVGVLTAWLPVDPSTDSGMKHILGAAGVATGFVWLTSVAVAVLTRLARVLLPGRATRWLSSPPVIVTIAGPLLVVLGFASALMVRGLAFRWSFRW